MRLLSFAEALGKPELVQWPPKSPDCNPLDYYFWNKLSTVVYEERRPFENIGTLKKKIRIVWKKAINESELQKSIAQFRKRLWAVIKKKGGPINTIFM